MLRHTIDRVSPLFQSDSLLTVIGRHQLSFAAGDFCDRNPRTIVTIPFNRETGASIVLSLAKIRVLDPDAIVAFFPSDHFILEENRFVSYVNSAFEFVTRTPDFIVLLAVESNKPHSGYGWMEKGLSVSGGGNDRLYNVKKFWEKPGREHMMHLIEQGCLWNTMIMVGRVETFVHLFDRYASELSRAYKKIINAIGTTDEQETIYSVFETIPSVNFSNAVLQQSPANIFALPMKDVYWNDWGEEYRIRYDLEFLSGLKKAVADKGMSNNGVTAPLSIELALEDKDS